jgi:phospholipid/cholesterol/gamma-HCH transport system ATP-binding protein
MSTASDTTVLRFENVSLSFDGEDEALKEVSFEVRAGESCVILGAAGSGKTVLLKTAAGLLKPDSGQVYLFDEEITNRPEKELYDLRSKIGILFQEGGLFDSLTIEENVGYPLVNQPAVGCPPEDVKPRVEEALHFVELGHTMDKFPSELSGGMRRRVGIARANVTAPPVVLYDSPTAGLDPITAYVIMGFVVKERDTKNTTTLMVTHRYQDGFLLGNYRYNRETGAIQAAKGNGDQRALPTKYLVMREGRLAFEGDQRELEASSDSYVQKFVKKLEN